MYKRKEMYKRNSIIGDYGKQNFLELIQAIESYLNEEDIKRIRIRIRISSIEPNLLSDDIINFIYKSKIFVNHFHIPLQSGSDEILNKMKRRYSKNLYLERIKKIRYKRNQIRLSKEKKKIFYIKQINKKRNVLFENKSGYIYGYTDNYISYLDLILKAFQNYYI